MTVGNSIKFYREKNNWTQKDLSRQIHVSRQTISNWENGISNPDLESTVIMSNIFNCSLDELLNRDYALIVKKLKIKNLFKKINQYSTFLLLIANIITLFINFMIERTLNWSFIPLAFSVLIITFIQTFWRVKSWPLLKATSLAYLPLLLSFFAIKLNTVDMDFYSTIEYVSLWYLYYLFIVYLIEVSNISFYTCLWILTSMSLPVEFFTRMILHSSFLFVDIMIKIALIFFVTLITILNIKGDYLNKILNKYRLFASNK